MFWFPLRWFINCMPFSVVYWLGGLLGSLDFHFTNRKQVQKMSANIAKVFGCGRKEAQKTIKLNFQNHFRNVLELIKYPQITDKNLSHLLYFEGINYLDNELEKGKGVILLTAHFGAKQALQIGLGTKGYQVNQIHYHMTLEELSWVQKHISQRQRMRIEKQIPTNFIPAKSFMRSAYKCLKDNQILIIAGDGIGLKNHMDKSYLPFDFLGDKMLFPTGVVSLARRTGASILPVFVIRDEGAKHKVVIKRPMDINSKSVEEAFQKFVEILEEYVRKYPFLWEFWEEFERGNLIPA